MSAILSSHHAMSAWLHPFIHPSMGTLSNIRYTIMSTLYRFIVIVGYSLWVHISVVSHALVPYWFTAFRLIPLRGFWGGFWTDWDYIAIIVGPYYLLFVWQLDIYSLFIAYSWRFFFIIILGLYICFFKKKCICTNIWHCLYMAAYVA